MGSLSVGRAARGSTSRTFGIVGPHGGGRRGPDEVIGLFGKLFQLTDGTFRVQIHDVLASDEHVVVLGHVDAQRAGKTVQNGNYDHVCHFRDGKLAEAWVVNVDQYEADAFFA